MRNILEYPITFEEVKTFISGIVNTENVGDPTPLILAETIVQFMKESELIFDAEIEETRELAINFLDGYRK